MTKTKHDQVEEARGPKQRAENGILHRRGVRGIDIGIKVIAGVLRPDQPLAIRVFVEEKGKFDPEEEVPAEIEGIWTDVIEVGKVKANAIDANKYRPIKGSVSCAANQTGMAGTLGAIVRDRATNAIMLLSASHVFCPDDSTASAILQPSPSDGGTTNDIVADVSARNSRIGGSAGEGGTVGRDCAVAIVNQGLDATNEIVGVGPINGITTAVLGEVVKKRGRTSGLTIGTITGIDASVSVDYPGTIPTTTYYHQISVQVLSPSTTFIEDGDSGALLLNTQNEAIGLLFAGSVDQLTGWASPAQTILDSLGIDVVLSGLVEDHSCFSWNNHLDKTNVILTASSEAGNMGVANLAVPHVGVRWRTVDATPAWMAVDLLASREIGVVGLFGVNFTQAAQWRVRLSNVGTSGVDVWDSGVINANVVDGYNQAVMVLPSAVMARYIQIDFEDNGVAGTDGYFDIGVAWIGDLWQPEINFSLGYQDGWIDPSVATKSRGGQTYVDVRPSYRVRRIVYDMLGDEDIFEQAHEMERLAGTVDNVLFIPEPFQDSINRQAILGRFVDLSPAQMVALRRWQKGLAIEERL